MLVLVLIRQWVPAARRLVAVRGHGMSIDGMVSVVTLVMSDVFECESIKLVVVSTLFTPLTQGRMWQCPVLLGASVKVCLALLKLLVFAERNIQRPPCESSLPPSEIMCLPRRRVLSELLKMSSSAVLLGMLSVPWL